MEKPIKKATVVLLINNEGNVCLARKKQPIHHEGGEIAYSLGLYNGYGGKIEAFDRTISDTAVRELLDESGVVAAKENLEIAARVYFYVQKDSESVPFMEVSFFVLYVWQGDPVEGREMGTPQFFAPHDIPYHEMMPADKVLLEKMFQGERKVYQVILLGKDIPPEVTELDEKLV